MRTGSFLCESDDRTLSQKLRDLIDHPATLDVIRDVAKIKLKKLLQPEQKPILQIDTFRPHVNLGEQDLDRIFSYYMKPTVTCRQLYDSLRHLKPMPSDIMFLRQGQIHLFVPPPFLGLTKQQYVTLLCDVLPTIKKLSSKYVEDKAGYHFTITF